MSRLLHKWLVPLGVLGLQATSLFGQAPPTFPPQPQPQPQSQSAPVSFGLVPSEMPTPMAEAGASPVFTVLPPTVLFQPGSARPDHLHAGDTSLEDRNGSLLIGNSLLDGPGPSNLGWFGNVELDLLDVQVRSGLRANLPKPGGATDTVSLPYSGPNWTVAPRFEVGYRFGQATGELLVSYRFVLSSGSETTPGFDAAGNPGSLHSQMNMHVIDFDYGSKENSLLPWCDMKWRAGIRVASLFFDSTENSVLLSERNANSFFGAGPHVTLELNKTMTESGLGAFFKFDVAGVLGDVSQSFEETTAGFGGSAYPHQYVPTASLLVQAGLTWTPNSAWRFSCGYSYEHWWDVGFTGQITQPPTFSRADVSMQGVFFHGEWKF